MSAQKATKTKKKYSFDSSDDDEYFQMMETDKYYDAAPIQVQNIDEMEVVPNLRTVGKSASFKEEEDLVMSNLNVHQQQNLLSTN